MILSTGREAEKYSLVIALTYLQFLLGISGKFERIRRKCTDKSYI